MVAMLTMLPFIITGTHSATLRVLDFLGFGLPSVRTVFGPS